MESVRFFVAGLPGDITEKDVQDLFRPYGKVLGTDLKAKKNAMDELDTKIIAFVTLEIDPADVRHCINALNWCRVRGVQINVSQAKESFLERLKREREEAENAGAQQSAPPIEFDTNASELRSSNLANTRKSFADDEEFGDDDIPSHLLITKKHASNSMRQGRIIIQSEDVAPIHVIESTRQSKKSKRTNSLNDKSQSAELKRKESLNKMKNNYQQKKSVIQMALSDLKGVNAKKICFEGDGSDEENKTFTKPKMNILGSDDEENSVELNLNFEDFGKKDARVMQLQSQIQNIDSRFMVNENFVDDDKNGAEGCKDEIAVHNERDWQINILQQVVGTELDTRLTTEKAKASKRMLHYDPSKTEHEKFIRPSKASRIALDAEQATAFKEREKKNRSDHAPNEFSTDNAQKQPVTTEPVVSKEIFYVVADTLAQSLKSRGEGFSLLNMFGKAAQLDERENKLKEVSNAKILVENKLEKVALNPFGYDSSTDEDICVDESTAMIGKPAVNTRGKCRVQVETFFLAKNDQRLKEGAKFFQFDKQKALEIAENYEEVRSRLKLIIKTKITKSKKNKFTTLIKSKKRGSH